uniref:phenylalanine--tRNA ligase n=1 Tax=Quercus lobata TaxID=97700 RepID=A0A7N2MT95_QUELO
MHRSDLLCLEGIAQALRIFNGQQEIPTYKVANISTKSMIKMHVKQETCSVRPYVLCAVLRDVTFDTASYNSFIDLQDKLHENICRQRTLVAIGTHDLDTLHGPFTYEALPPSSINFVPLKQEKNFRADELMEFYKSDLKLEKFLHIIENSPVFPVLYDSTRTVLSLPPIINGAHSAIKLETKNVFIECTATDLSKAKIVLNVMAKMLSEYCERKFEIEPVEVIYCDGKSYIYPDLSVYNMGVSLSNITGAIGVPLVVDEVIRNYHAREISCLTSPNKPSLLAKRGFFFLLGVFFYSSFYGFWRAGSRHVKLNLNIVKVLDLNRIFRFEVYIHFDGQLRPSHLILDYIPTYRGFQDPRDAIKAKHPLPLVLVPYVGGLLKKGHQDHEKETALRQVLESKLQIRAGDVPVEMLRSWDVPESST